MKKIVTCEAAQTVISSSNLAILYFGSVDCGVCRDLKPKVENLLLDYPRMRGAYIEIDEAKELAAAYSVFTLPAILVFAEGKEVIREARHISLLDINARLERYYNLLFD